MGWWESGTDRMHARNCTAVFGVCVQNIMYAFACMYLMYIHTFTFQAPKVRKVCIP